jgi:hypothetical protein
MIVHVNLTDLSCGESVIDNVDPDLLGRNWEYRPERYCMTEHMVQIDLRALHSCPECGYFFNEPKM